MTSCKFDVIDMYSNKTLTGSFAVWNGKKELILKNVAENHAYYLENHAYHLKSRDFKEKIITLNKNASEIEIPQQKTINLTIGKLSEPVFLEVSKRLFSTFLAHFTERGSSPDCPEIEITPNTTSRKLKLKFPENIWNFSCDCNLTFGTYKRINKFTEERSILTLKFHITEHEDKTKILVQSGKTSIELSKTFQECLVHNGTTKIIDVRNSTLDTGIVFEPRANKS